MKALEILQEGLEFMIKAIKVNPNSVKELQSEIDIYNEAIKELEELKNRGCIGCINLTRSNSQDCISCSRQYQDNFKIAKNKQ